MKLIIDIPEELYKKVVEHAKTGYIGSDVWIAVANGTPLPKVHGALIDEDILLDKWNNLSVRGRTEFDQVMMCQPLVIPADKGMCYNCQYKTDSCQEGLHCIRDGEG